MHMGERIRLDNISFGYGSNLLFQNVSFAVEHGGVLAVAGRSGSGKSTLLELAAGLQTPLSGQVEWKGCDLHDMTRKELLAERHRTGYLFQTHALIHNYPVFENIALPLRRHFSLSEQEIRERVFGQLARFGLMSIATMLPDMLSFGQARCASLARALVASPELVFLDEPTSALDPVTTGLVVDILNEYRSQEQVTFVMVSHNAYMIRAMGCKVMIIENKRLVDISEYSRMDDGRVPDIAAYLRKAV
jgi:phospholipid/cholesterol/gamma-HCH transport system ATP-binding protein